MPYAVLSAELSLNTKKFEQGLEFAETMMKGFVGPTRVVKLALDTKSLNAQLKQAEATLTRQLKAIVIPVELKMTVNGQAFVIEQSKAAEGAIRRQETATKELNAALAALERRGFEAFVGTLKGATDISAALDRAQAKLREIGTVKAPSSKWSVSLGDFNKVKEAEADLKRLGASLERDAKFTAEFNAHLQKMQGLIDGAAARGEKLGTQIANRLLAAAKNAETANNAFALMGRGLSAVGSVATGVSGVLLGLGRSFYNFARGYILLPLMYRGFSALKEATIGYNITLERARTSLTSMMNGSEKAANALLDKLEDLAIRSQFNFDDLAGLAPQLRVAKVASEDLVPTFTAMGDAVTSASKGREGLKALSGDMVSLSMRGKVTGQDLRNFAANGVNLVTYLAQAYSGILPPNIKQAELAMRQMISKGLIPADKAIKAFVAGVENDPLRMGAMARQSRTLEGSLSNIGDAIKRALGKEAFGDTFQWLTKQVTKFLDIVSSQAFLDWGKAMAPKVLAVTSTVAGFFGTVINWGVKTYNVLSMAIGWLVDTWPRVQSVGAQAFKYISAATMLAVRAVGYFEVSLNPLAGLFQMATDGAHDFWDVLRGVGSLVLSIGEGISQVLVPAVWTISKPLVGLSHLVTNVFDAIPKNLISRIIGADSANDLSTLMDGLKSATKFVEDASTFGGNQKLWQGLQDSFNNGVLATEEGWKKIKDKWKSTGFDSPDFKALIKGANIFGGIDTSDFTMPNYGWGDTNTNGDKAAARAKKLETDRLADAVALYDAMAAQAKKSYDAQAKAAEDSAKRQLDSLKSIQEKFSSIVGDFQDSLAKYGVFGGTALDPVIARLEKLLEFGPRMAQTTKDALDQIAAIQSRSQATQQGFALHSLHAKMAQDKLGGGDGQEPARAYKAAQLGSGIMPASTAFQGASISAKQLGTTTIQKLAEGIPQVSIPACANFAGALLNRLGVAIPRTNIARDLALNAKNMGARRISLSEAGAGDLIVYRGHNDGSIKYSEGGRKVGYHVMVGAGNGMAIARNRSYYGPIRAPGRGEEGYAYDTSAVAHGTRLIERAAASFTKAAGVSTQVGADESMGEGLVQSLVNALQDLKLSKMAPIPPAFGATIKDAEGHAGRFKIQMILANEALQKMLRASLSDKGLKAVFEQLQNNPFVAAPGAIAKALAAFTTSAKGPFDALMRQLGLLGDTFDRTETRLRARQQTFDLWAKQRMRGKENDPLARLFFDERPGGPLEFLKPDTRIRAQANQLRANPFVAAPGAATRLDARFKADGQQERDYISAIKVDVVNNVTEAFKKLRSAEADRLTVVKAGLPFIRSATVDLYGYARAIQLAQEKIAYARSDDMVKLFQTNKHQFNLRLAEFTQGNAQRYESQKGTERELAFATQTRDLGRRLAQLQAEQSLVGNVTLSEGALNIELEKQGYYFGQLYALRDAGHDDERSIQLAKQLTAQNALNAAMERAIAAQREWNKSVAESKIGATLNSAIRGLYATMKGGPALDRAIFEKQTRSDLQARYDSGDFDVPTNLITSSVRAMRGIITAPQIRRDPLELEKRVQQNLAGYEDKTLTERFADLNARWTNMSQDLKQRQAELLRPLSELDKVRLDFKIKGVGQSKEELDLQGKILATARQLDSLASEAWRKQQAQQLTLASIFDPAKRADQQFRFDHPEWSEEQINAMLPVDQMSRKLHEGLERMQGLMDGWRDSWTDLFRDIAKGQFTFGSFLDGITNKLLQWAADTLSSAAFQGLQGLLGQLTGAIIGARGMGSVTARVGTPDTVYGPPNTSGYVGNIGGYSLRGTSAMPQDYLMRSAQQITAGEGRRTSSLGSGDIHNWDFKGATINVAEGESLPEAAHRHIQTQNMNQPTRDSRRTISKKLQTIIGN
ncbi:hypothetical protein IAD21_01212 [Abditibacteriota bacterium]|nr:hypothetical protein IAD21_01212 [Abditibacteriota bacterium]